MKWINTIYSAVKLNSNNAKKQKQFGYLVIAILILYLGISVYKNGLVYNTKQIVAFSLLVVNIIITFYISKWYFLILFVWLLIGELLGKVTSTIVLSVVYFLLFTPIALILNLLNRNKRYKPQWIDRTKDNINYQNLN